MDKIVSGQSCVPPLTGILEHAALLKGVSFKKPECRFDFGLGQLSQESSREEVNSQTPERQDCGKDKNRVSGDRLPTCESRL